MRKRKIIPIQREISNSLLSRLMAHSVVRFGVAVFLAAIMSVILLLLMRLMVSDYDEATEDAVVRIFSLKTVVLANDNQQNISIAAEEGATDNTPVTESNPDAPSRELQEILRKKNEIISILESESE